MAEERVSIFLNRRNVHVMYQVTKEKLYSVATIDHVGNAFFITKIDLLKGYWQVELTETAKAISAFVTMDGL